MDKVSKTHGGWAVADKLVLLSCCVAKKITMPRKAPTRNAKRKLKTKKKRKRGFPATTSCYERTPTLIS